jgi:hypothetical protein
MKNKHSTLAALTMGMAVLGSCGCGTRGEPRPTSSYAQVMR